MTYKELLRNAEHIAVITGAGVSTDSGIPDFKTTDNNWTNPISRVEATSISYFQKNPENFWKLYRELFISKTGRKPNDFHYFLRDLELNHKVTIITQNVDGLHTTAGNKNVINIHGTVNEVLCSKRTCRRIYNYSDYSNNPLPRCPNCNKLLKPNVVLFGESVKSYEIARNAIVKADLLLVAGTSLDVSPVNLLPNEFAGVNEDKPLLWINRDQAPDGYDFTDSFTGELSDFVKLVK